MRAVIFITAIGLITCSQADLTDEQAVACARNVASGFGFTAKEFTQASVHRRMDSRPKGRIKYGVDLGRCYVTLDHEGRLIRFHSTPPYNPSKAAPPGKLLSEKILWAEVERVKSLLMSHRKHYVLVRRRFENLGGLYFRADFQDRRGGYPGGESFTVTVNPYNGKVSSITGTAEYPYAKVGDLITEQMAVGRARDFWQRFAPANEGKWPGNAVVLATVKGPRWQWPWKLWNSAGTKTSLARGQWELAYILDVNDYYVHVNAHNGEIMGGQRRPFSEPRPRIGTTQLQPVKDSPPMVTTPSRMPGGMVGRSAEVDPGPFVAAGAVGGVGLAALAISALRRIQRP